MEKIDNSKFNNLSDDELVIYNYLKKMSLFWHLFIFILLLLCLILSIFENYENNIFYLTNIIDVIISIFLLFDYFKNFFGKPVGIVYGHISKRTDVGACKYSGYKYNIKLDNDNITFHNVQWLHISKFHQGNKVGDRVCVIKSRLGFYYFIALDD